MKRVVAALLVVALQTGVLGYMVYEREWTLRTGEVVYLRTLPVDPRDPFRGDYVQLSYEINRLPAGLIDPAILDIKNKAGTAVYAQLESDARGVARVTHVRLAPPAQGLFIRGRLLGDYDWRWAAGPNQISVKYGVEKFFVPQGAGLAIEERRGTRTDWQLPMEIAVALNDAGTAVIRDYRWSDIATKLEDLTVRPTDPVQARDDNPSPHLRFNIRNDSQRPIAFITDAQDCAFSLEAADGQAVDGSYTGCADALMHAADVVVLQPGEVLAREFKLEAPRWHIRSEGFSGEIGKLQAWQQFRLAYRPPAPERFTADITPEQRALLWGSAVLSPAFNNRGRVD